MDHVISATDLSKIVTRVMTPFWPPIASSVQRNHWSQPWYSCEPFKYKLNKFRAAASPRFPRTIAFNGLEEPVHIPLFRFVFDSTDRARWNFPFVSNSISISRVGNFASRKKTKRKWKKKEGRIKNIHGSIWINFFNNQIQLRFVAND